jgi:hypothetical protein
LTRLRSPSRIGQLENGSNAFPGGVTHGPRCVAGHRHLPLVHAHRKPSGFPAAVLSIGGSGAVAPPDPGNQKQPRRLQGGGPASAKREYLQVGREKLIFDICGAPFGTGFFVSWWLAEAKTNRNPLLKIFAVITMLVIAGWTLNQFGFFWGAVAISVVVPGALAINNMARNQPWGEAASRAAKPPTVNGFRLKCRRDARVNIKLGEGEGRVPVHSQSCLRGVACGRLLTLLLCVRL